MSTLAKSGALFALHRNRRSGSDYRGLHMAARFCEIRQRQLRRAIRRQKFTILRLRLRALILRGCSQQKTLNSQPSPQ